MNITKSIYNIRLNEKKVIPLEIPEHWEVLNVIHPKKLSNKSNLRDKLEAAINKPQESKRLDLLLKDKKNVVIISDDQTRPTPVYEIINIIIEKLNKFGIKNDSIKVVIGKGLHPSPNEEELKLKFKDLTKKISIYIHDPDNNFEYIGDTSSKVPVEINKMVLQSDFKISLGTIKPHEMTGFSGGAAIIIPGVASRRTIRYNHSLLFKIKEHSYFGNINGNPIRKDMEEAASMVNLDLIINVILDNNGNPHEFYVGDFKSAHKMGAQAYIEDFGIKIKEKSDLSIISAFPRHKTIGKGLKALFVADLLTKKDGSIICFIDGEKGISSSEIFEELLLKNLSPSKLFSLLKESELPGEACILYLFSRIKQRKIIIITKPKHEEKILKMGLSHAVNFEEALKSLDENLIKTVNLVPEGIDFIPLIEK